MDKFAFHFEMLLMPEGKRSVYKFIFWTIVIVSGNIFFSCQNENCVSVFNNYLLVGFVDADTLESGDIEFPKKDTLFYSVTAIGNNSVFYDKNDVVSTIALPVNPALGSTTFHLEMIDSIRYDTLSLDPIVIDTTYYINPTPHTITVSYDRKQRIISVECGVEIAYRNLKVEEISFPTSNLTEDKLSRFNEVNIEVFF